MIAIAFLFAGVLCDCFKSRRRLEAEILVLRHQLNVLQQRAPRRLLLRWAANQSARQIPCNRENNREFYKNRAAARDFPDITAAKSAR